MSLFSNLYKRLILAVGLFFIVAGCATYQSEVSGSRQLLQDGQFEAALPKFKILADKANGDQLVHLLDYGTALQMAGQYQESNKAFLYADKLAEAQDFHSVTKVTASMLTNEEMVQYKGDTFEKIFINAYLALNYLQMGQLDDALVETRRLNEKYLKLRADDKQKTFELNPFAKYLSAVIWEGDQKWDDAYIAYDEAYKLDPTIQPLKVDLIRSSKRAKRMEEYKKWKEAFPEIKEDPAWYDKSESEIVVIFQQGWGPRKNFAPHDHRVPTLVPVRSATQKAVLQVESGASVPSQIVYNTEAAAIKTLQDDAVALAARRVAAFAAKEVMADQIRQKNELLGFLSSVAMHASERADLRQWSTLPQTIQFIRVPVKAGTYKLTIQGQTENGDNTNDRIEGLEVKVKPGRKAFVNWRSLR